MTGRQEALRLLGLFVRSYDERYGLAFVDAVVELAARLPGDYAQALANLTGVQARCTELLLENRELKADAWALNDELQTTAQERLELRAGDLLPHWTCSCGCFNGSAGPMGVLPRCRACDAPRPT